MHSDPCFTPKCHCPQCGYGLDAASCLDGESAKPEPGDISVCIKCGAFLEFAEDMTVHLLAEDDFVELEPLFIQQLNRIRAVILRMNEKETVTV